MEDRRAEPVMRELATALCYRRRVGSPRNLEVWGCSQLKMRMLWSCTLRGWRLQLGATADILVNVFDMSKRVVGGLLLPQATRARWMVVLPWKITGRFAGVPECRDTGKTWKLG